MYRKSADRKKKTAGALFSAALALSAAAVTVCAEPLTVCASDGAQTAGVQAAGKTAGAKAKAKTKAKTGKTGKKTSAKKAGPVPYILDMDFCTDVDDVCALAEACELDCQGIIDLKAVMLSTSGDGIVQAAEGVLDWYGLTDVPVGTDVLGVQDTSPYREVLRTYRKTDHRTEPADLLYGEVLNANSGTVICTTGYLTELCAYAVNRGGKSVLADRTKCAGIYITGGGWQTGWDNNFSAVPEACAASEAAEDFLPDGTVFVPSDFGGPVICGAALQKADTGRTDPVTAALHAFGTETGRAGWDPSAVWISVTAPSASSWSEVRCGFVYHAPTGENDFTDPGGTSGRFFAARRVLPVSEYSRILDLLLLRKFLAG